MELHGADLVRRYKANYSLPPEVEVSEEMVHTHWNLERELTGEILTSLPAERWETVDRCYTRLYTELPWLNEDVADASTEAFRPWTDVIGEPPLAVYEVGSGKGRLIEYLAEAGYTCRATEITRERGARHVGAQTPNLTWAVSDGINLADFEAADSYDVVISNQVVEHLHPDDLVDHLRSVRTILRPGGRYIFSTPHRFTGPHDISRVFDTDTPQGMHLREYSYRELLDALREAGLVAPRAALMSASMRKVLPASLFRHPGAARRVGAAYLRGQMAVEGLLGRVTDIRRQHRAARTLRRAQLFAENIFLVAERPRG